MRHSRPSRSPSTALRRPAARGATARSAAAAIGAALAGVALLAAAPASAQSGGTPRRAWAEATVGSEWEGYLRAVQLDTAMARLDLQGVRAGVALDAAHVLRAGSAHPWGRRVALDTAAPALRRGPSFRVLRPSLRAVGNSAFPFGFNDGAVWAGRGLTTAVELGFVAVAGPLTLRVQPVAFRAENSSFDLFDPGATGDARFRDAIEPYAVDQPQRFGDGAYQRVDPGASELRLDLPVVAVGLSTAPQTWGPATTHPIIMGPNAAGFAHAFVGTRRPVSIGIGRVHARVVVGRLEQTRWSLAADTLRVRTGSGFVATFEPRGLAGLEIGATRFFHTRWVPGEVPWNAWRLPFEGLLFKRGRLAVDDTLSASFESDNQVASAFFRWAFPRAGFELYGEFARNDAALDLRELITEPDHDSAWLLGFRRLVRHSPDAIVVARGEWVDARVTHLDRLRPQARFYQHGTFVQGHTHRGEVLGSVAVLGGSGLSLGVDRYDASGRRSASFHRIVRLAPLGEGSPTPDQLDVQHALGVERTWFRRGVDLVAGATVVWEMNRDFRGDAVNLNVTAGVRLGRDALPARR